MKRFALLSLVIPLATLSLVACGASPDAAEPANTEVAELATTEPAIAGATETPTQTTPTAEPSSESTATLSDTSGGAAADTCPEPTEDTYLLRNPLAGYCLLYPDSYTAVRGGFDGPNPTGVRIVNGSILNLTEPWAAITTRDAAGRTFEELRQEAQQSVDNMSENGFDVELFEIEVAGQPAILLTGLLGQDMTRVIHLLHGGLIYDFTLGPDDAVGSKTAQRLTEFADVILNSLAFIPVTETITMADECLQPRPDEQLVIDETLGFCLLLPPDYTHDQPSEESANFYVDSMMDVEHPKLMIEVTNAGGQTAEQAAGALAASFPDAQLAPSCCYTVGSGDFMAYSVDGVPGQDLGRVLLVVGDDRLYRLTFVPFDPSNPEMNEETEALFRQVTQSFRFLP